jgi:hypothetical protein
MALDRLAENDPDPNSVFTRVLVPAMVKPGMDLTALAFEVREDVSRLAASVKYDQRPAYYDETIGGRVYLAGLPREDAKPTEPSKPASGQSEAERAWLAVKDTTSVAVLEEFRRQYPGSVYARFANARIEELKRAQVAVVAPPAAASVKTYSKIGNFACFSKAEYPDSWREEASLCVQYGCNFGKMSQDACLTLGARKRSKTVIHGNTGTTRANECWLQHSCSDLRPHSEFTLFRM